MTAVAAAAKSLLGAVADLRFFSRFKALCGRTGGPLLVVDIDNTIAATHAYEMASPGRQIRVEALEPVPAVAAWLEERAPGTAIVYLAARHLWTYRRTAAWLRWHGFPEGELILVPTAGHKLRYLRHACSRLKVVLIDDLSYLDDRGELRFHDEVIREVRRLDVTYLDYNDIAAIVAGARQR
jgi:hypothetical protein